MRGLASTARRTNINDFDQGGGLPVPFNIPNVLHNLLFEDIDLSFDAKQKDLIEALAYSYKALDRMQTRYALKEQKLLTLIQEDAGNMGLKEAYEDLQLDEMIANHHFKDLVTVVSEALTREQYQKLMKFSGINV